MTVHSQGDKPADPDDRLLLYAWAAKLRRDYKQQVMPRLLELAAADPHTTKGKMATRLRQAQFVYGRKLQKDAAERLALGGEVAGGDRHREDRSERPLDT